MMGRNLLASAEKPQGRNLLAGQQRAAPVATKDRPYSVVDDMGAVERGLAGFGKALIDLSRGYRQVANPAPTEQQMAVAEKFGGRIHQQALADQAKAEALQAEVDESRRLDAPLMDTAAGIAGNIAGNVVAAAPTALIPGANTVTGAALTGAVMGALQPTAVDESRTGNAAAGAALGAVGQKIGQKVASHFARKVQAGQANQAANLVRDASFQAGRAQGYTVAPATINPTLKNRMVEGLAGKANTQQGAAIKNQQVTNRLARRALGLAEDTPITRESLEAIRAQAGQAYEAVKQAGDIITDPKYIAALDDLAAANQKVAKDFPTLARREIDELIESLKVGQFDAESGVEAIKQLRANGNINPGIADPSQKAMASAYRKAAGAMEDLLERHLARSGQQDMVKALKSARQLIAKTYSVEGALNEGSGNVIAAKLAQQLKKGKPLSGELEMIAKFSQAFPKLTQEVNTSMPGISPLDFFAAGGMSAASGDPSMMGLALLRPAARGAILSKTYQQLMSTPTYVPATTDAARALTNHGGVRALMRLAPPAAYLAQD